MPTFDQATGKVDPGAADTTSLTYSVTVGAGGDDILLVGNGAISGTGLTATFDGDAMTSTANLTVSDGALRVFYLTGNGNKTGNVVVGQDTASRMASSAISFTDVHQTTPFRDSDTNTGDVNAITVPSAGSVTSDDADIGVSLISAVGVTPDFVLDGPDGTLRDLQSSTGSGADIDEGASTVAGAGAGISETWTAGDANNHAMCVWLASLQAPAAGGGNENTPRHLPRGASRGVLRGAI